MEISCTDAHDPWYSRSAMLHAMDHSHIENLTRVRLTRAMCHWTQPCHQGSAPAACSVERSCGLEERTPGRRVLPRLQDDERLQHWCTRQLLRVPSTGAVALAELVRLEVTRKALATMTLPQDLPTGTAPGPPRPHTRGATAGVALGCRHEEYPQAGGR